MGKAKEILEKLNEATDLQDKEQVDADLMTKLEKIAKDRLFIDTLETRDSDDKDFHDLGVWNIADALKDAYLLGLEDGKKQV